jgi:hypothetical protein
MGVFKSISERLFLPKEASSDQREESSATTKSILKISWVSQNTKGSLQNSQTMLKIISVGHFLVFLNLPLQPIYRTLRNSRFGDYRKAPSKYYLR